METTELRELVRQRVWLVKIGRAMKSAEETADDIISMIVEECAKIAESEICSCKEEDLHDGCCGACGKKIAAVIRKVTK